MTLTATPIDVGREVAGLRAELEAHADSAYATSMRRIVPSELPAHAVRVPEIRRIAAAWSRANRDIAPVDVLEIAEALWATGSREERIVAMQLVEHCRPLLASLPWEVIERWSSQIDNWEHVDHLASAVTYAMLRARRELIDKIDELSHSAHSWQRRLAIVTLIEAARRDASWHDPLATTAARLEGDRGPTMRKAVAWAKKTLIHKDPEFDAVGGLRALRLPYDRDTSRGNRG